LLTVVLLNVLELKVHCPTNASDAAGSPFECRNPRTDSAAGMCVTSAVGSAVGARRLGFGRIGSNHHGACVAGLLLELCGLTSHGSQSTQRSLAALGIKDSAAAMPRTGDSASFRN
jgi:hypothetical protein